MSLFVKPPEEILSAEADGIASELVPVFVTEENSSRPSPAFDGTTVEAQNNDARISATAFLKASVGEEEFRSDVAIILRCCYCCSDLDETAPPNCPPRRHNSSQE